MKNKGFNGMSGALIGVMVAVIIGVTATINVIYNTLQTTCATGTTLTILNLLPLGVAVILLVAIFSIVG